MQLTPDQFKAQLEAIRYTHKPAPLTAEEKIDAIYRELQARQDVLEVIMNYIINKDPTYNSCEPPMPSVEFTRSLGLDPGANYGYAFNLLGYVEEQVEKNIAVENMINKTFGDNTQQEKPITNNIYIPRY